MRSCPRLLLILALATACTTSDTDGPAQAPSAPPSSDVPPTPGPGAPPATSPSLPDFGLGARIDDARGVVRFRVLSPRATRVELSIFAEARGAGARLTVPLARATDRDPWAAEVALADITAAGVTTVYYGYRVWGPNWPYVSTWKPGSLDGFVTDVDDAGDRFDPNKLLYDPYALELSHDPFSPAPFDGRVYEIGPEDRARDSALVAPKGIVLRAEPASTGDRPTRALADDVVYEVHVRGLTMNDPSVPAPLRGTYLGAAHKAKYLRSLGVTAIELLPIHESQNDGNDTARAGANYWGYASNSFFAPDRRFASDRSAGGPTRELRAMVRAFHDEGVKVYVDVVYNHTGEGGSNHLLSWRGFGAATYYEPGDGPRTFADNNGVGPNFHPRTPAARQLVVDSLTYYARYLGVDGFRFDLASVLGDRCASTCFVFDKLDPTNAINRAAKELPARPNEGGAGVDLIAEPWAIGLGTYQVGGFPHGWAEWNGEFRDVVRRAQNRVGVADVTPSDLAEKLLGSPRLYEDDGRPPAASVNFLTAHDGFTLRDLYSYDQKQNEQPWPFGPSTGGTDDNISWNQGGEPADQEKAARTGILLLAIASGVPMILGGDELYRTQRGNNNAYNLDNEAMWLDWSGLETHAAFHAFFRGVLRLRNAHPALRPRAHRDVALLGARGAPAAPTMLGNGTARFLAMRIDGAGTKDDARSIYVAYNWGSAPVDVLLPAAAPGRAWRLAAHSELGFVAEPGAEPLAATSGLLVPARTAVVLVER